MSLKKGYRCSRKASSKQSKGGGFFSKEKNGQRQRRGVTIALKTFYDFSDITHRIVSALLCLDKLGPVEKPAPTRFKLLHLEEYLSFPIKDGLSFLEKEILISLGRAPFFCPFLNPISILPFDLVLLK